MAHIPEPKFRELRSVPKYPVTREVLAKDIVAPFGKFFVNVYPDVPSEACLPWPEHYQLPSQGQLEADVATASIGLIKGRPTYIWGFPGTGKDALIHAFSAFARRPSKIFTVQPGADLSSWFWTRGFSQTGTFWEEGEMLRAIRDGYLTSSGRVVPYLILITDFDRADRSQAEILRLLMDSIQGRVVSPTGETIQVLAGTQFVVTANTSGSGDHSGRMVSANPLDSSLLDRFSVKVRFSFMDWADEERILKKKFPILEKEASMTQTLQKVTVLMRSSIKDEKIFADFSHRSLCAWIQHAQDTLELYRYKKIPTGLLTRSFRVILDGMPDNETRIAVGRLLEPHLTGLQFRE